MLPPWNLPKRPGKRPADHRKPVPDSREVLRGLKLLDTALEAIGQPAVSANPYLVEAPLISEVTDFDQNFLHLSGTNHRVIRLIKANAAPLVFIFMNDGLQIDVGNISEVFEQRYPNYDDVSFGVVAIVHKFLQSDISIWNDRRKRPVLVALKSADGTLVHSHARRLFFARRAVDTKQVSQRYTPAFPAND